MCIHFRHWKQHVNFRHTGKQHMCFSDTQKQHMGIYSTQTEAAQVISAGARKQHNRFWHAWKLYDYIFFGHT